MDLFDTYETLTEAFNSLDELEKRIYASLLVTCEGQTERFFTVSVPELARQLGASEPEVISSFGVLSQVGLMTPDPEVEGFIATYAICIVLGWQAINGEITDLLVGLPELGRP